MRFTVLQVNTRSACLWGQGYLQNQGRVKEINDVLLQAMRSNLGDTPGLKWQYYGSEEGMVAFYPANKLCDRTYDPRFRWVARRICLLVRGITEGFTFSTAKGNLPSNMYI